jgi:heterodisulfide reductase subunit D
MASMSALNVLRCLDCGKCTSACPVARYNRSLSPRRIVRRLGEGHDGAGGDALWACLTCMYCDTRCPQQVSISKIMPAVRAKMREAGEKPPFTRCGAMESISVIQSQASVPQNRLDWVPADVKTDPAGKTVLWIGCTPYFDAFYAENGVKTVEAVIGAIRILNAMGIEPALLKQERCCGHDALWAGDHETFERLAKMNVGMFEMHAPELVLTVCPECSLMLGREYKELFGQPACEVKHFAEWLSEHAQGLPLQPQALKVTFEDPCRLGRHQGKYDEPRRALGAVPGLELMEMGHNRGRATCCSGNWLSCNQATKRIQTDLLKEAQATGSEMLVTACPKCMIHLKCAQTGDNNVPGIEIRDLVTVVAGALAGSSATTSSPKERG